MCIALCTIIMITDDQHGQNNCHKFNLIYLLWLNGLLKTFTWAKLEAVKSPSAKAWKLFCNWYSELMVKSVMQVIEVPGLGYVTGVT